MSNSSGEDGSEAPLGRHLETHDRRGVVRGVQLRRCPTDWKAVEIILVLRAPGKCLMYKKPQRLGVLLFSKEIPLEYGLAQDAGPETCSAKSMH